MNTHDRMYSRITEYGENLKKVFDLPENTDPVKLCKKLHSLEIKTNFIMTQYVNGDINLDTIDEYEKKLYKSLEKIIGKENMEKIHINQDPRGYTIKLTLEATQMARRAGVNIHRDLGGYGIVAPTFTGKE